MFCNAHTANPDVSHWDVSQCVSMFEIFSNAYQAELRGTKTWDTSSLVNAAGIFRNCTNAQPDVRKWELKRVTSMDSMFQNAKKAVVYTGLWDVSNIPGPRGFDLIFDGADAMNSAVENGHATFEWWRNCPEDTDTQRWPTMWDPCRTCGEIINLACNSTDSERNPK